MQIDQMDDCGGEWCRVGDMHPFTPSFLIIMKLITFIK